MAEMKEFVSPQTESVYIVFAQVREDKVCYREIDPDCYRVRIQCDDDERIECMETHIANVNGDWSGIKGGDHISIVVEGEEARDAAVEEAINTVTYCNDNAPVERF